MKSWGIKNRILLVAFLPAISISVSAGYLFTLRSAQESHRLLEAEKPADQYSGKTPCGELRFGQNSQILVKSLLRSALQDQDIRSISILSDKGDIMLHAGPQSYTTFPIEQLADDAELEIPGSKNHCLSRPCPLPQQKQ